MEFLKISSVALSLILASSAWAKKSYPVLLSVQGKVWITGAKDRKTPAKKNELLRGHALIETDAGSEVSIAWDADRELTVLAGSQVQVPAIAWETGEAPVILLKAGAIRWRAEKESYNVALRSDLFEFIAPKTDFIISMDPVHAYTEVKVYRGALNFSCLNGDESEWVKAGQKAGFQGVLENGRIAYDILLKGRKIPRGKLTPVTPLERDEYRPFTEAEKKREKQLARERHASQAAAAQKRQKGQICESPLGKYNQCAWICLGNPKGEKKNCVIGQAGVQCVRRRCNANGEWAEETPVSPENAQVLCKAQDQVGPCDY